MGRFKDKGRSKKKVVKTWIKYIEVQQQGEKLKHQILRYPLPKQCVPFPKKFLCSLHAHLNVGPGKEVQVAFG